MSDAIHDRLPGLLTTAAALLQRHACDMERDHPGPDGWVGEMREFEIYRLSVKTVQDLEEAAALIQQGSRDGQANA